MAEEVKLFGCHGSPFSCRVEIALNLKGIQYEYIEEDLFNKSPLLLNYNPIHKKIPILLHNRKPICESLVILEYIDDTWKDTPILPQDPYERAMARFWTTFHDEKCMPALWKAYWSQGDEEHDKAKEESCELLKFLENELNDKKFFGGDNIGMLDIAAGFLGFWVGVLEEATSVELLTKDKFPNICRWVDEFVNCSVIRETLPPKEKLLAIFRARLFPASAPTPASAAK